MKGMYAINITATKYTVFSTTTDGLSDTYKLVMLNKILKHVMTDINVLSRNFYRQAKAE